MGRGFVAEAVEAFRAREWRDSGGAVLPGLVSGADLAAYSATWEQPALLDWHGVQVAKTGLWGQGPSLLQVLAMLDQQGAGALDPDSEAGIHAVAESWKLAMADREAWFGDRSPVQVDDLLSRDYVAARAGLVGPRPAASCARDRPEVATPPRRARTPPARRRVRRDAPPTPRRANRPSSATEPRRATPATSTSSTAGAT